MNPRAALLLALLLAPALAGCTGGAGTRQVSNTADHFRYEASGARSGTDTYDWQNSGIAAKVRWNLGGAGSATVTLIDSAGRQVYQRAYSAAGSTEGTETSEAGSPGTWKIRIDLQGAGSFRVVVDRA